MAATIEEVAQRAGVNKSTVSRALNGSLAISQKRRLQIQEIAQELGYVGNAAARNLASNRVHTLAVVFPPVSDKQNQPFFMQILTAINAEAEKYQLTVAIVTGHTTEELKRQVKLMHLAQRADGFIILYTKKDDLVQQYLARHKVPFVLLGKPEENSDAVSWVNNDNLALGRAAVEVLQAAGHEKIAFVTNTTDGTVFQERYRGFSELAGKSGRLLSADSLLSQLTNETALVVLDDVLALSVMQELTDNGRKLADDLSLVSYNNSFLGSLVRPQLTTFDIHVVVLGETVVKVLQQEIETGKHQQIQVDFTLVERDSIRRLI